jgi:hypothetical protein
LLVQPNESEDEVFSDRSNRGHGFTTYLVASSISPTLEKYEHHTPYLCY